MLFHLAYLYFFLCQVIAINYLISLKLSQGLESFLSYDATYPQGQRIKEYIAETFQIGNFTFMSGNFSKTALKRLKRCPLVADISPDLTLYSLDIASQDNCPRHLARISLEKKLGNGNLKYFYNTKKLGAGVNAYVIDSGISLTHPEFEGRAVAGMDFTGEGSGDLNGHGTHVAGLIGSRTFGVAKDVDIIEVKALNSGGAGSLSTIISAIEFTVNHRKKSGKPGVANLSLGATRNRVLNQAVEAAVDTGLIMVVAAGNSNVNACLTSPASSKAAITIGAIDDRTDRIAPFSNWGDCVDVFASGVFVASVHSNSIFQPQILSGTSMASPIVAGLIATMLGDGTAPRNIKSELVNMSLKDQMPRSSLFLRMRTPNRIAYNQLDYNALDSDSDTDDE